MRRNGIDKPARVPASAVQHWEGLDWHLTEPPPRPVRRPRHVPAQPVEQSTPVDANAEDKAKDTKPKAETRRAPSGRKED